MKLSVLITTYNLEKYIAETLDSVLMQKTDFEYEIIVGDDGSSDKTQSIVEEYQKKYPNKISMYVMPREEGVAYNRIKRAAANRLNIASHALGEYCTFLDGDDYYTDSDKLQKQVEILDDPANSDCSVCAHNIFMAYEDGTGFMLSRASKERKFTFEQYWKLTYICTHGLLFRNNFKEHMPSGNIAEYFDDNLITFWCFGFGNMYYIPDNMAAYRQLSGSNWNEKTKLQQYATNILDYGIELYEEASDKKRRRISDIRHFPEYAYIYRHRKELSKDAVSPSYEYAENDGITEALGIFDMNTKGAFGYALRYYKTAVSYYMAKAGRFIEKKLGKY